MTDERQTGTPGEAKPAVDTRISRRRLAAGGVAASVLTTLASRTALAGNYYCTLSGALSGNLSRPGSGGTCGGLTCGYWKTHPDNWPSGHQCGPKNPITYTGGTCTDYSVPRETDLKTYYYNKCKTLYPKWSSTQRNQWAQNQCDAYYALPTGTPWTDVFSGGALSDPSVTLMQTLWMDGLYSPPSLLPQCVCAYFNAVVYGPDTYGYSPNEVRNLVNNNLGVKNAYLLSALDWLNQDIPRTGTPPVV